MIDSKFAFILGDLVVLIVWLILFIRRRDFRSEMIIFGLVITPGALTEHWFEKDYWVPETFTGLKYSLLENALFSFLIAGIAAVIYEEVANRGFFNRHMPKHTRLPLIFPIIAVAAFVFFTDNLGWNSMYSFYLGLGIISLIMLALRRDLIKTALMSALLVTMIFLPLYILFSYLFPGIGSRWWMIENLSGITLWGYPIEELGWYPVWGLTAGPLYEFAKGLSDRRLPRPRKKR